MQNRHSLDDLIKAIELEESKKRPPMRASSGLPTSGVHESASSAAILLRKNYVEKVIRADFVIAQKNRKKLKRTLKLTAMLWKEESSLIKMAARRFCNRIFFLTTNDVQFRDPVSAVNLFELLKYTFFALVDGHSLQVTLDEALDQLAKALYEAQRGGNIGSDGVDDQALQDKRIDDAETFNKIIEGVQNAIFYLHHEHKQKRPDHPSDPDSRHQASIDLYAPKRKLPKTFSHSQPSRLGLFANSPDRSQSSTPDRCHDEAGMLRRV